MEWVETTGKTVEEAIRLAVDQLGVAEADAEVEVVEEPRTNIFGRPKGAARVKARVRPVAPRPKNERRRGRRGAEGGSSAGGREGGGASSSASSGGGSAAGTDVAEAVGGRPGRGRSRKRSGRATGADASADGRGRDDGDRVDHGGSSSNPREPRSTKTSKERVMMPEAEQRSVGEDFLRSILETFDYEASVSSEYAEDGLLSFDVGGDGLGLLIGPGLATLDALQEITRNVIQRAAAGREYGKVSVDVCGAREARRTALEAFTREQATKVLEEGEDVIFDPMSRSDRKIVHDVIGEFDGLATESVGEDPRRRVILRRA